MRIYYGQENLDKYIHENFITQPFENGSFLELGAIDGILYSNTKFFEDNMGFNQGVLIEPDPDHYKKLKTNRPNCQCFNYAIHSSLNKIEFLKSKTRAVGCVESEASEKFKKRWHSNCEKLVLPAIKLSKVLSQTSIKYIDFWSLDVEGSELECLKSMDWNIPVGLLCIEMNHQNAEINEILKANNFTLVGKHEQGNLSVKIVNSVFFNENYFRKNLFNIK